MTYEYAIFNEKPTPGHEDEGPWQLYSTWPAVSGIVDYVGEKVREKATKINDARSDQEDISPVGFVVVRRRTVTFGEWEDVR